MRADPVGTALIAALIAAFATGRIVLLLRTPVFAFPDSPSYRGGSAGLTAAGVLSFTGHSGRLWGTPLFYAAFSDDHGRAVGQWALAGAAWILLALVICGQLRSRIARVVAVALVLGFALLPQVASWDFTILSEPLSVSLGVTTLALLIWFLGGGGWPVLAGLTVSAFWWTFVRPELRVLAGFVILVLIGHAVLRRTRRWAAAAAAGVLIVAAGWVTAITPNMDRTYGEQAWSGVSLTDTTFLYRLRLRILPDPPVLAVYRNQLHMPDCAPAEQIARGRDWQISQFVRAYLTCPDLVAWTHTNAASSGYRFALAAPGLYASRTARIMPNSLGARLGSRADLTGRVLPRFVEPGAFPGRRFVLPAIGGGWLVALLWAVAAGAWRRRRLLVLVSAGTMVAAGASLLIELMYSAGDYARFGIQEALLSRIAIGLMLVAALDATIVRRSAESANVADTAPAADEVAERPEPAPVPAAQASGPDGD